MNIFLLFLQRKIKNKHAYEMCTWCLINVCLINVDGCLFTSTSRQNNFDTAKLLWNESCEIFSKLCLVGHITNNNHYGGSQVTLFLLFTANEF